jgi:penicillin-binding protein A
MNDISTSIKKVLIVILIFFIGLTVYISYFEIFVGPQIVNSTYNKRLWVKRNEVLRGTIFDRNMKPLTKSEKVNATTQNRTYIDGPVFAHVLGYENIKYGITGLERKYDQELMSSDIQDNILAFIKSGGKTQEKVGSNLKTTLDSNIQQKAYDLLGNNRGAVVVLNPKTGEILAMVSKPSFDPNNLEKDWNAINTNKDKPLINRATAGLYPPGSTFKTLTAISSIENIPGIMNRTFNDTGKITFNSSYSLSNFNGEVLGNIGFKQAYVLSSNVAFGTLGMDLGNTKLKATADKFYFNKDIPADGISVEASKFPTFNSYEKGNIAQSAIGQSSVLASPLQMAIVASTIANDGVMMKPYLVNQVVSNSGTVEKTIFPVSLGQIISNSTALTMKDFMKDVVVDGTGRAANIQGIQVCGKTGTADHNDEGKNAPPHSWFIGFAPYNNPQVAIAVIVEDGGQGGIAAASIAAEVIRTALK